MGQQLKKLSKVDDDQEIRLRDPNKSGTNNRHLKNIEAILRLIFYAAVTGCALLAAIFVRLLLMNQLF